MIDRIAEFFIFGFLPLVVGILAAPELSVAAEKVLKGEVTCRERIALPPDAVLSVRLAAVSRAGAPAAVIGEQKIVPAGQAPMRFEVRFDPSLIRPDRAYVLQARVTCDNGLLLTSEERHDVDPLADVPRTLMLKLAAQA